MHNTYTYFIFVIAAQHKMVNNPLGITINSLSKSARTSA